MTLNTPSFSRREATNTKSLDEAVPRTHIDNKSPSGIRTAQG